MIANLHNFIFINRITEDLKTSLYLQDFQRL
jgi:hypothetical protein